MKIAIQAADLDHDRIDGTRVYIFNSLKHFGHLDTKDDFLLFHGNNFNPQLTPPDFSNYKVSKKSFPFFWTQTIFAYELWKSRADVLWMPMAAMPFLRRKKMKTVVTIHDLAFKRFPETFTGKDRWKLNFFADYSIRHADKIIAVSQATKQDILEFYPEVGEKKIRVIHHGFSPEIFSVARDRKEEDNLKNRLGVKGDYILYVGALQPRKNIVRLIEAFNGYKKRTQSGMKLVLAAEKAWKWEEIEVAVRESPYQRDIIMPGGVKFCDLGHLMRGTGVFVLPSLYEGFGIPILEAFAAGVPLIAASNSSLPEVAGDAALYFDAYDADELSAQIERVLASKDLQAEMIVRGKERLKEFSWEKCARETLEYIIS